MNTASETRWSFPSLTKIGTCGWTSTGLPFLSRFANGRVFTFARKFPYSIQSTDFDTFNAWMKTC